MNLRFEADDHPGRPRILFVCLGESSHTRLMVDLFEGASFNIRLFSMPGGSPPDGWPVRSYVTAYYADVRNSETRARLFPPGRVGRFARRGVARVFGAPNVEEMAGRWLAKIIRRWRPDVVHTLGLSQGDFYLRARRRHSLEGVGTWVLQTLGGADLALTHLDPERRGRIGEVLHACDHIISDNAVNFRIARELGVGAEKISELGVVPGYGGVDVGALAGKWQGVTSSRRLLMLPKAYESQWSKVLPVFEALKLCWERIRPCEVQMLAMDEEARMWFWALPPHIRDHCRVGERVAHERVLEMMTGARVMLAPSLIDGVPNAMYEAMAAGAVPVVSPLETIRPVVEEWRNVLYARNLYPEEIASALVRAMTDDALVDAMAEENLTLVQRVFNRQDIAARLVGSYERIAAAARRDKRHSQARPSQL